jgi:tRNA (guanine-N7-)-methyltransferase
MPETGFHFLARRSRQKLPDHGLTGPQTAMSSAVEKGPAFFGRRRGKGLRRGQQETLERELAARRIDLSRPPPPDLRELFCVPLEDVRLEIGFGGGEHLMARARSAPQAGFIGVEPFLNGMAKLMRALEKEPLGNVRVFDDDAVLLLDWLPALSLSGVDLLYPDPWPKRRHWKRRFVSRSNLDRLARVMRPGAVFRFASDIDSYVNWTLRLALAHPSFEWAARHPDDWRSPFPGWPGTRYEAKALREGRRPAYLAFVRR